HRGAAATHCSERCPVADAQRAARCPHGGRRPNEPGDRARPLRHPEDGRTPPLERLPQARNQLALPASGRTRPTAARAASRRQPRRDRLMSAPRASREPVPPRVLLRSEESEGRIAVIESTMPPRAKGPPLHTHGFNETFYVLDGELIVRVGDELTPVGAGEVAFARRHATHARQPERC